MQEEEVLGKAYDSRLMRRLVAYLRPYKSYVALALALILLESSLEVAFPWLTKIAIDRYIAAANIAGLTTIAAVYVVLLLVRFVCASAETYVLQNTGQKIMYDMRMQVFRHLHTLAPSFYDKNPVGRLITRVITDVDVLNELFSAGIVSIFGDIFTLSGIMVAIALIIWYGGGKVIQGALTLGALVAFTQYSNRFFQPIADMSEKYNILQSAMASSERLFRLIDTPATIINSPHAIKPARPPKGEIEFRNVWFAYEDQNWVLKDVSFHVHPGESVAIVGHTGAGKTTTTSLLTPFYDIQKGEILLDGVNIAQFDLEYLRSSFAVVLQDVFLFSGTIESNIRLGSPIPREKVVAAAEDVNLAPFLRALPLGVEHPVNERGTTFSVGQRQLLAFARALAHDPQILILDEATSSVDTETELQIRQAIDRLMQDRTSIIIAHRLSTIQRCDKIIVMHKGRVREIGTHQQLLAQRGIYYKLYQLQYKDQEVAVPGD